MYSMSFTTGALLHRESLVIAHLYRDLGDWIAVRERVVAGNLLQMRTVNASRRICREVISRLKQLTAGELDLLVDGARREQGYLLWLAVCKRYRFIAEFASEVVHEKFLRLDLALSFADYDAFFNAKAEWHNEVAAVAPATRRKQRQVVFKMMREAELLSEDNHILPAMLTPQFTAAVAQDAPALLTLYPAPEPDLSQRRP